MSTSEQANSELLVLNGVIATLCPDRLTDIIERSDEIKKDLTARYVSLPDSTDVERQDKAVELFAISRAMITVQDDILTD